MDRPDEVLTKLDVVRGWLERSGHAAALFRSQANFAWLTAGGRNHVSIGEEAGIGWVLVGPGVARVLSTNIEYARLLDEEVGDLPFDVLEHPWHRPEEALAQARGIVGAGSIVTDLPIGDVPAADPSLTTLRFTLQPPEVDRYRALGLDAARAVESTARAAEPGMTELEISGVLARECGARDILPLVNLVAADERIARYRHPIPTVRRLERALMIALTGRRHGLHASLTRFVSFGDLDPERADRASATARVDARYILASRHGVSLADAFARGLDQYASEGFPEEWKLHHQGGLTGYGGREIFATHATPHRLDANQALAWNPSITGAKSEDTVLVTDAIPEILTRTGEWPDVEVTVDGESLARPGSLIR
jgi:Xaa-Pro aminopeptidase